MSLKQQSDHIMACDGTNPEYPFGFACTHCGAKDRLPKPIPIDAYLAWARAFTGVHINCAKSGLRRATPAPGALMPEPVGEKENKDAST